MTYFVFYRKFVREQSSDFLGILNLMLLFPMIQKLGLYFRTMRYLRLSQVGVRLYLMLVRRWGRVPSLSAFPDGVLQPVSSPFSLSSQKTYLGGRTFSFLNDTRDTGGDWVMRSAPRLWCFNLHYFAYLLEDILEQDRVELVLEWIEKVPPGARDGWHSYTISLRVCHWVWAFSQRWERLESESKSRISRSLGQQLYVLRRQLEFDVLGNHLLENCKALIVGGVALGNREYWQYGYRVLMTQLQEQILLDGGHYERSTMYHFIVLESVYAAYTALCQVIAFENLTALRVILARMCDFGDGVLMGDRFHLWNDSAYGVGRPAREILKTVSVGIGRSVEEPRMGLRVFSESGLVVYRSPQFNWSWDVGPGGPDFLMGHVHNDCLSYCLDLGGEPVVTDSGVYEYQAGEWRTYFRSTAAHNTVQVAGEEQSEIWSSFRVGRRGYPIDFSQDRVVSKLRAFHTGYDRIGVRVGREIAYSEIDFHVRELIVSDREVYVASFIHFSPSVTLERMSDTAYRITGLSQKIRLELDQNWESVIKQTWYSPQFGQKVIRQTLVLSMSVPSGETTSCYSIGLINENLDFNASLSP